MTEELMLIFDEDGIAREYKDDFDITIHCESKEEQGEVWKRLTNDDWTPISKDLPEELIAVNVTWVNHDPAPYYKEIKDKRFVDTAVYYQGDWYWWDVVLVDVLKEYGNSRVTYIDSAIEIIAWKPLPKPWEGEQDE